MMLVLLLALLLAHAFAKEQWLASTLDAHVPNLATSQASAPKPSHAPSVSLRGNVAVKDTSACLPDYGMCFAECMGNSTACMNRCDALKTSLTPICQSLADLCTTCSKKKAPCEASCSATLTSCSKACAPNDAGCQAQCQESSSLCERGCSRDLSCLENCDQAASCPSFVEANTGACFGACSADYNGASHNGYCYTGCKTAYETCVAP